MGWTVNNLLLIGSLEVILEGVGNIYDTNGEVICESNGCWNYQSGGDPETG